MQPNKTNCTKLNKKKYTATKHCYKQDIRLENAMHKTVLEICMAHKIYLYVIWVVIVEKKLLIIILQSRPMHTAHIFTYLSLLFSNQDDDVSNEKKMMKKNLKWHYKMEKLQLTETTK